MREPWTPRDVIALVLALTLAINPLATMLALTIWGRPLAEIGGQTLEAIVVATLAVVAGYLAGSSKGKGGEGEGGP